MEPSGVTADLALLTFALDVAGGWAGVSLGSRRQMVDFYAFACLRFSMAWPGPPANAAAV